jgi:alkylation response protein AidB-like acyl-CoA dehydrogenase
MTARSSVHPLVEAARAFSERVLRPRAGEFDEKAAIPRAVLDEMAAEGFLGSILPREYGGGGLDPLSYGQLTAEIGKGCSSARSLLTVHTSLVGESMARFATPTQKRRWLPELASGRKLACFALSEPEVGSDAAAVRTAYREAHSGYVLNGAKKWISYGAIADVFLTFAHGEHGTSVFLVERGMPGVSSEPMTGLLANRGAHIAQLQFDDVAVPPENLLGRLGAGFDFVANQALSYGRYSIAWAGVAIAEAALEEMVGYAREREQFGKKLRQHQLIQQIIADAVTGVHAGRALCERVGRMRNQDDPEALVEANVAKYFTSRVAMNVTLNAVQLFGGNGCWNRFPVERLFREAKLLEIIEGSSQIQQVLIADAGLRRYRRRKPSNKDTAGDSTEKREHVLHAA